MPVELIINRKGDSKRHGSSAVLPEKADVRLYG